MKENRIKKNHWVICPGHPLVGTVTRVARDGSWADVNWQTHVKRMQTHFLEVQTTLDLGDGMFVSDLTRK